MKELLIVLVAIGLLVTTVAATSERGGRYTLMVGRTLDLGSPYGQFLYRFDTETGEVSVTVAVTVGGEGPTVFPWTPQRTEDKAQ